MFAIGRLTVIHDMRNGAVVFPAKIYRFGRRAVTKDRFKELFGR